MHCNYYHVSTYIHSIHALTLTQIHTCIPTYAHKSLFKFIKIYPTHQNTHRVPKLGAFVFNIRP